VDTDATDDTDGHIARRALVRLALPNWIDEEGTAEVEVHGSQGAALPARRHTADAQG
jgi:hypothetical protein